MLVYTYFATAGTWQSQPASGASYYALLADAFLAGQLHLPIEPSPELLALPDPYDPRGRGGVRYLFDASLYNGRYYLYWGPVPALYHAAWQVVTRSRLRADVAQVAASTISAAFFWAILIRVRARHLPTAPRWIVWCAGLAFAVGGLMLHLIGRPSIYHEAQQAAMAFLLPGLYVLLVALDAPAPRRWWLLALGGLLLGCAAGSRIIYAGASFGPTLVLAAAVLRAGECRRREVIANLVSFGAPVGTIAALLLAYNYLRFDSPFEFGIVWSLHGSTWFADHVVNGPSGRTFNTLGAVWVNLPLYFLSVPNAQWHYPWFPYNGRFIVWPSLDQVQVLVVPPLLPIWLVAPTSLLAVVTPLLLWRCTPTVVRSFAAMLAIGTVATLLLLLTSRIAEMRYLADVLTMPSILAALVVMQVSTWARWRRMRRAILACAVAGWAVSLAIGPLTGFGAWQWQSGPSSVWIASVADPWGDRLASWLPVLPATTTLAEDRETVRALAEENERLRAEIDRLRAEAEEMRRQAEEAQQALAAERGRVRPAP